MGIYYIIVETKCHDPINLLNRSACKSQETFRLSPLMENYEGMIINYTNKQMHGLWFHSIRSLGPFIMTVHVNVLMGDLRTIFTLSPQVNFKQAFRIYSPA